MNDQPKLSIEAGKADRYGVRVVTAAFGDKHVRDKFDIDQEWRRRKFRERVIEDFGIEEPDAHGFIESELLRVTDAADNVVVEFKRLTSRELATTDYSLEFLIDNALVAGQPLIIGGPQKVLKTSFVIDAAISLAVGGKFLGYLPVNRTCRVAVMTGESGLATIQETATRIAQAAGRFLDDLDNLLWSPDLPRFGDRSHLNALERFLKDDEIEVLFIDPAYLCMPSAESSNIMAQGELLRGMANVCQKAGAMLCLAHHSKRNTGRNPFDPIELSDLSWAGFAEFARQWWLINRREAYEPGTGDHKLWLNVGGSAGHSGLWAVDVAEGVRSELSERIWSVSVSGATEARKKAEEAKRQRREQERQAKATEQMEADRKKIVEVLTREGPLTKSRISSLAGIRPQRIPEVLADLLGEGVVAETTVRAKSNGKCYEGFQVAS